MAATLLAWALGMGLSALAVRAKARGDDGQPGRLSLGEVGQLVRGVKDGRGELSAAPTDLATALAWTESHGDVDARRFEPARGEASIGLFQTLPSTAQWLFADMGYDGRQYEGPDSLLDPRTSAYFGLAYLDWLAGQSDTLEALARKYNGGPNGDTLEATRPYWAKVRDNLKRVREGS